MQKRQAERERRKQEILKAKLHKKELEEKKILEEKNRRYDKNLLSLLNKGF